MQKQGVLFLDLLESLTRNAKPAITEQTSRAALEQRGKGWLRREARDYSPDQWVPGFAPLQYLTMLYSLCDYLEDAMLEPLRIEPLAVGGCNVWVLGLMGFRISIDLKVIAYLEADGQRITELGDDFNLANPFDNVMPYRMMVEHVFPALVPDVGLRGSEEDLLLLKGWLASRAQTLLLRDKQFQFLIRSALPKAMKLPPELERLCLAMRPRPYRNSLRAHQVQHALAAQDSLHRVQLENPQLLRLIGAYFEIKNLDASSHDPMQSLSEALRARGVQPATWRYIVKHGDRILKLPWRLTLEQPAFEVAVTYLLAMQAAELPAPPPLAVTRVWLQAFNVSKVFSEQVTLSPDFYTGMDPRVLSMALREAHLHRNDSTAQLSDFIVEFLGVCWWCKRERKVFDKNQVHAGWASLVQHWKADQALEILMASTSKLSWETRLKSSSIGPWKVTPIRNSEELIKASLAMRNCLKDYLVQCATRTMEFCLVQHDQHRSSLYCIGFSLDLDGDVGIVDVKGFANSIAPGEVNRLAMDIQAGMQVTS